MISTKRGGVRTCYMEEYVIVHRPPHKSRNKKKKVKKCHSLVGDMFMSNIELSSVTQNRIPGFVVFTNVLRTIIIHCTTFDNQRRHDNS